MNNMSRREASRPREVAADPRSFHPWAALGQPQLATRQRSAARARLFALQLLTEWAALLLDDPAACVAREPRPSSSTILTTNALDGLVLQDAP
jgi:hypothetical protein